MRRVIFHIDVNSAFLSWIAIKILTEGGSDIRLVPAVVSGDPSDRAPRVLWIFAGRIRLSFRSFR